MSPFWIGVVAGLLVGAVCGVGIFIGLLELLGAPDTRASGRRHAR